MWADTVQTAAVVIGAGALVFGYRQARLARHGGGGANVLALWSFLQSDAARANRRELYRAFERSGAFDADAGNWTEDEIESARHVCQVWSVAGALAKRDLVPLELLVDEWGPAIRRTWARATPVVTWERRRVGNPQLFKSYEWLFDRVARW